MADDTNKVLGRIKSIVKTDTDYRIKYVTGEEAKLNILNSHVFKYYMSPTGTFLDYPEPINPTDVAKINIKKISDYDDEVFKNSFVEETDAEYVVNTNKIKITFDKSLSTFTVHDNRTEKDVLKEKSPISYQDQKTTQTLVQNEDEHYFGGGMQNGRFTHKGQVIKIVNSNSWVDGGVSSPCPFYWSSYGYGVLRNTWQSGIYDFGFETPDMIQTVHQSEDFDAFFFINSQPKDILNDYYELTGKPILVPEFALYESHFNTFNRDYWVKVEKETPKAVLFEDGFYYKSYQPQDLGDKTGILESLNGEKDNYQFSARAMIDRYERHDMPLGWFIPNDGYGSGYGQTDSFEGDLDNLKKFELYAKEKGVKVALWTESNLEPEDPEHPEKGERDLGKEVSVAGTVALKCDVAWIGDGYSFGLNAVENATNIFLKASQNKERPMILMVDGWAGTQRYSSIWTGDQNGGEWEYIRFHIPTYIGAGLSGIPLVGSDMDGIYYGGDREVNIRDYQWKAFTPLQLNMDGWGNTRKTPFNYDEQAIAINRAYLKLKSMMLPYNYSIAHESIEGLPMIRAMFLEFPEEKLAYTKDSQYQFMWGPWILVAPVYNKDSVRNSIYLPSPNQVWIDLFTGERCKGGKVYNSVETPLWKIPVFVRDGAIIPLTHANNNPQQIKRDKRIFMLYPNGDTSFEVYEDDGSSCGYLSGQKATTRIRVSGPASDTSGDVTIHIEDTKGSYEGMVKERSTLLIVMASKEPEGIKAAINDQPISITPVKTEEDFDRNNNVFYFNENFVLNPYLTEQADSNLKQYCVMIKIQSVEVSAANIHVKIKGFENKGRKIEVNTVNETQDVPLITASEEGITFNNITVRWNDTKAHYYEIERDGDIFSNIRSNEFTFEEFKPESEHLFRIRSVETSLHTFSKWSDMVHVTTKQDPLKNTIKDVKIRCNVLCQPGQEIGFLTCGNGDGSIWHTIWGKPDEADPSTGKIIELKIDLQQPYSIDKIEYTPREDSSNGTILQIQYRFSIDGDNWSELSDVVNWECDNLTKTIHFEGEMFRYIDLNILNSVGGYGSGKHLLFHKKK